MAEEGQTINIACRATGHPKPAITWSKSIGALPKGTVASSTALKINNAKRQDSGVYICKAENILGRAEGTIHVMIFSLQFSVRPPRLLTLLLGSTLRLPCVAKSDLNPTVTWLKDGKPLLPVDSTILQNNTLVIPSVRNSHAGSYTCRASNALSTIEAHVEIKTSNTPSSCSVIRKYVSSFSGNYVIDPDGNGGLAPFTVYCDMSGKNGVGVTVISHDSESRTLVDGYNGNGEYSRNIHYSGASFSQLAKLTDVSTTCEQFIKYECYHSQLLNNPDGWWVSRSSSKMTYWGGASPRSNNCACGMTNSCADSSKKCNCDKNDAVWREDSGLLTVKTQLPVKQLRFGDTTEYDGHDEKGYHTLGKLRCYGIASK